jgi:hypothetical protein
MAKKLKTYQTSLGFYDLAVAAPSMKAALAVWGVERNLFHEGVAKQSDDPDVVAAAMAMPGVVLKRPVGSSGAFKEHAALPTDLAARSDKHERKPAASQKKKPKRTSDRAAERRAVIAFEKAQKRRERKAATQEAARRKARERREHAVAQAQSALDAARRKHDKRVANIRKDLEAIERMSRAEDARWDKERIRLEAALKRAQE